MPLDYGRIMKEAAVLDAMPKNQRRPLHGLCIGVTDVILTKGSTQQRRTLESDITKKGVVVLERVNNSNEFFFLTITHDRTP